MDLLRIAARVAQGSSRVSGPMDNTAAGIKPRIQIYVQDGSPLATDTDGELGIKFTQLLEGVGTVEWSNDSLSIVPNGGAFDVAGLLGEMKAGKHGPDMQQAVGSLQLPGTSYIQMSNKTIEQPFNVP